MSGLNQMKWLTLAKTIVESWVTAELYKAQIHVGQRPNMFHYRENRGPEVDLLIESGEWLHAIETKFGATVSSDFLRHIQHFAERMQRTSSPFVVNNHVVYGGEVSQKRTSGEIVSWRDATGIL